MKSLGKLEAESVLACLGKELLLYYTYHSSLVFQKNFQHFLNLMGQNYKLRNLILTIMQRHYYYRIGFQIDLLHDLLA